MAVMLIAYDVNSPGVRRDELLEAIKAEGAWTALSESAYAVHTTDSPRSIFNRLAEYVDSGDTLIVLKLARDWWGMSHRPGTIPWLQEHL